MCSSGRVLTPLAVRRSPSDEFFEVAREVLCITVTFLGI